MSACSKYSFEDTKPIFLRTCIELFSCMVDGVANHGNAGDGGFSRRAKRKERRRLHLDCECSLIGPLVQLRFGLAVRGIRRPDSARADWPPGRDQFALKNRDYR